MTLLSRVARSGVATLVAAATAGCVTPPPARDYSVFSKARPATILVLPPVNDSPDVKATPAVWAHATLPLAEAGYYVLPVTLVDETFRQNGVAMAADAHDISPQKLREYFGADAAVYIRVTQYGSSYTVIASEVRVAVEARLVDLRSGELLWEGKALASSAEQQQQNQGGLVGLLVAAIVKQVINSTADVAVNYAAIANQRLLGAPRYNGLLAGPRSPQYGQPPPAAR
jgi:hypothetical protein